MKLSIIIPAYNEEAELPVCLDYLRRAQDQLFSDARFEPWQLIVADNNSTDSTRSIAEQAAAQVVFEPINQIAKARNAGASVATGEWFLFIDADSRIHVDSLRDLFDAIHTGTVGAGGCLVRMDDAPMWGKCGIAVWNCLSRFRGWAAGSFVFCRADAYHAVGGFNEEYYAAEELHFSRELKGWCKTLGLQFKILTRQPHASSARKFHMYSHREIFQLVRRVLFSYGKTVRDPKALDFFYDGRRTTDPAQVPSTSE